MTRFRACCCQVPHNRHGELGLRRVRWGRSTQVDPTVARSFAIWPPVAVLFFLQPQVRGRARTSSRCNDVTVDACVFHRVAQLGDIADMLRQRGATVGQVWRDVVAYGTTVNTRGRGSRGRGLFYCLVTRWGSGPSAGVRTEPAGQGAPDGSALSAPAPASAAASGEGDAASGTSGLEDGTAATASPHAQSEP